jgi:PKD repeat protein
MSVQFTDLSTGVPTSWYWEFGDGNTSTSKNPSHVYAYAGTFSVHLKAMNAFGSDWENKTSYLSTNVANPVSNFIGSPLSGNYPLVVSFTDLSTNYTTTWLWDFGDGNTSNIQSPAHSYEYAGNFTVSLNSSNSAGYSYSQKIKYVIVNTPAPHRPKAVTPVPTMNETRFDQIFEEFGSQNLSGNISITPIPTIDSKSYEDVMENIASSNFSSQPDPRGLIGSVFGVYTGYIGGIALVMLLAIPFLMMWITQVRAIIPGAIGVIISGFAYSYMPAEYQPITMLFIAMYVVSIIYSLWSDR